MKIRHLSFISRITILVLGIEIVAFSILGWQYVGAFVSNAEKQLYARFELIEKMLGNDDLPISTISRQSHIANLLEAPYIRGMAIGGNGRVIVSTVPAELGYTIAELQHIDTPLLQPQETERRFVKRDGLLTAILPIVNTFTGQRLYTVVLTASLSDLERLRTQMIRRGVIGSLIFIFLSSLGTILIAHRFYQTERETARAKKQLEHVLWSSGDGWWDWNIKTGHIYFDERWVGMLGYTQDEIMTDYLGWASLIHPEDLIRVLNQLYAHLENSASSYEASLRMQCKNGEWKWILTRGKVVEHDDQGNPIRMAGTHSDITDRIKAEEQIYSLAFLDPLTQLPNRRLLMDRLGQALIESHRNQHHGALLILDLDNFKDLNDTQGHHTGDQLLIEVSDRLQEAVREVDIVARLGGDEYVILLNHLDRKAKKAAQQAETIAEKIRDSLACTYQLDGGQVEYHSTPSIGVTLFIGDSQQPDILMKQADVALYQAKDAGRNCIRFFNQSMQAVIDANTKLIGALRKGLEQNEFELYYQTQHDERGDITGAETLLRWHSASEGTISPAQFIPLAEESGLIVQLGQWVIEQTCNQLKAWETDERTRHLTISINVSPRQFYQADFVDHIQQALQRSGANPAHLTIELTESTVIKNVTNVVDKMNQLQTLGLTVSLDDFGIGYSSLSYLKQLPISELKIDKSFVRDIHQDSNDVAIIRAILSLGRSLELKILAEGVETEKQRRFLLENGCRHFQGYLFCRPMPASDLQRQLTGH